MIADPGRRRPAAPGDDYGAPGAGDGRTPDPPPRTVAELVRWATRRLDDAGVDSPGTDARWLVAHALELSAAAMVRDSGSRVAAKAAARAAELVERRAAREPLQLIVGETSFRGHRIIVESGVFIPRPETELLVEHALARLPNDGVVVEPCTGTGAVSCAIAVERPASTVVAVDIDPVAADLARRNAASLGAAVEVLQGGLMAPVPGALRGTVDVIVSNPPYLATTEWSTLPPEVAEWDPRAALIAGPSGHEVSDALLAIAVSWLRPGGWLVLELDERRVEIAAVRARAVGLVGVEVLRDLAGRPRYVAARRPGGGCQEPSASGAEPTSRPAATATRR